jgi:hypothetical protein
MSGQGETPAGMAAGVSIGDEGQGREGEVLDTSHKSNDGTRLAVPASLMNVHCIDRATLATMINRFSPGVKVPSIQNRIASATTNPTALATSASKAIQVATRK